MKYVIQRKISDNYFDNFEFSLEGASKDYKSFEDIKVFVEAIGCRLFFIPESASEMKKLIDAGYSFWILHTNDVQESKERSKHMKRMIRETKKYSSDLLSSVG